MAISLKTHKILWGRAAGRCAFPDCRKKLIMNGNKFDDESLIGEECHIVARELNGPRGDSPLTSEERDEYENLILLCRIHHKLIDDQFHTYTVQRLQEMKTAHETWVIKSLHDFSEIWNVPYQRNSYFVGREEILHYLHETFAARDITATVKPTVICGLGGIGKTQIVVEYIYRYYHEFNSILWIRANTEAELRTSFVELAKLLGLFEQGIQNVDDAIQAVKKWLEHANNWLLIFDNADTPEQLKAYLPRFITGQILLTSRAQVFDSLGISNPIEVLEMSHEEAVTFLLKRTERNREDTVERNAVAELAHELGYLPLALEQAGAYIIAKKVPFGDYLVGYRKHHLSLLKKSLPRAGDYPESITTTWAINFREIENVPIAADILRVSAFLSPDNIPFELITIGASRLGQTLSSAFDTSEYDQLTLYEALEPLTRYSLIRLNTAEQTYNIHRLIQEVLKDDMDASEQFTWAKRTIEAISLIFPSIDEVTKMAAWFFTQRYFSHVLVCIKAIQYWNMNFLDAGWLLHETAAWLAEYGEYTEAEPLSKQALDIHKRLQGESHPDTIKSQMNLASLYINQGKYDLSEPLLNKSLAGLQGQTEPNNITAAACLDLLALLYSDQGQYERAEALYQQALTGFHASSQPTHVDQEVQFLLEVNSRK